MVAEAHAPVKVFGAQHLPGWVFIRCVCGASPTANVWLRDHWSGDPEAGKAAASAVIAAQAAAACDAPCCTACGGAGGTHDGPCSDCYSTGHTHPISECDRVMSLYVYEGCNGGA